jgi:hypothetical protein
MKLPKKKLNLPRTSCGMWSVGARRPPWTKPATSQALRVPAFSMRDSGSHLTNLKNWQVLVPFYFYKSFGLVNKIKALIPKKEIPCTQIPVVRNTGR